MYLKENKLHFVMWTDTKAKSIAKVSVWLIQKKMFKFIIDPKVDNLTNSKAFFNGVPNYNSFFPSYHLEEERPQRFHHNLPSLAHHLN